MGRASAISTTSAPGAMILGHGHPEALEAITRAALGAQNVQSAIATAGEVFESL